MTETSRTLSIIAYYLSEYDMDAVHALGFNTQKAAFKQISVNFNRDNNYLKLRRDEFDALPESSSHRNGWRNRPAAKDVVSLADYLRTFSFEELSEIVKSLIASQAGFFATSPPENSGYDDVTTYTEEELETLINYQDTSASLRVKTSPSTVRVYNTTIIRQLKKLYQGKCQLCGSAPFSDCHLDLTEVHHIDYFASSHNNNASNLIVLCPNHHRLIHKLNPRFNREEMSFVFGEERRIPLRLNYHL